MSNSHNESPQMTRWEGSRIFTWSLRAQATEHIKPLTSIPQRAQIRVADVQNQACIGEQSRSD